MTRLSVAATALFLASTAVAHAGNAISFEIEGQRIHIKAPRNCASLDCVTIVASGLSKRPISLNNINLSGFSSKDDRDTASSSTTTAAPPAAAPAVQQPAQPQVQATVPAAPVVTAPPAPSTTVTAPTTTSAADVTPQAPVAPPAPAAAPIAPTPATVAVAPAPVVTAPPAPSTTVTAPATTTAANVTPQTPIAPPAPAAAPIAPTPATVAVAPAPAPTTPLGLWATEENKGNVRVEQCGANLCGYAEKTNEKILINMQPDGAKWAGRIHDPDSGRNYDSTIAMKGPNLLRVQGCAFGGIFCGGQTWKRVI